MMEFQISEEIKNTCPELQLALLQAGVQVTHPVAEFWEEVEERIADKTQLDFETIKEIEAIHDSREAYKALGKDPSRYRLSAEALHRRLVKGRSLYRVNNVVDIINLASLKSGISIGGYDLDKIRFPVILAKGKKEEPYEAIGRGKLNIENLPVLYDQKGPLGSPTSDSERTMITTETINILLVFFDFNNYSGLQLVLDESAVWLKKYCSAKLIKNDVIR